MVENKLYNIIKYKVEKIKSILFEIEVSNSWRNKKCYYRDLKRALKYWKEQLEKITLVLIILLLYSCEHKIDSGIVIKKQYIPTHIIMQPIMTGKVITYMPIMRQEQFWLIVNNDTITENFHVRKDIYDKYNIGDSIYFKND